MTHFIKKVGVDIFYEERMSKSLSRYGERFVKKFARESEISLMQGISQEEQLSSFARLFCAKEAVYKICGFDRSTKFWLRAIPMKIENNQWQVDIQQFRELLPDIRNVLLDIRSADGQIVAVAVGDFAA